MVFLQTDDTVFLRYSIIMSNLVKFDNAAFAVTCFFVNHHHYDFGEAKSNFILKVAKSESN
jgi:hypothetical protein